MSVPAFVPSSEMSVPAFVPSSEMSVPAFVPSSEMSVPAFVPSSVRRDQPRINYLPYSVQSQSCAVLPRASMMALHVSPFPFESSVATPVIALLAIAIGFVAQTFINSMLKGDRGLGAFLSDGSGYSGSGFRPRRGGGDRSDTDAPLSGPDPLPWLKLPQFDFVEVAGQETGNSRNMLSPEEEAEIMTQLEDLQSVLREEINAGNTAEANRLRRRLEELMGEYGFQYEADGNK